MIPPPVELTAHSITDWLEANLLGLDDGGNGPLRASHADLLDALEEASVDDPEAQLANLRAEVQRRQATIGARYPITRQGRGFVARGEWQAYLPYSFMLFISLNQFYAGLRFVGGSANEPAELFESLATNALSNYVGGNSIRIGAPRRAPVPAGFPEAVKHSSDELFEIFGYGDLEIHDSGDDGLDIITYKAFADTRSSQLVILSQCAIGTNWREKRSELDLEVWQRHIRFATKPSKAFVVPFQVAHDGTWAETALRGGIIFDRGRLATSLQEPLPAALGDRITAWCATRRTAVQALAA